MDYVSAFSLHLLRTALCLGLAGISLFAFGKPSTQQLTLREQLNQTYAHELVFFPFSAEKGACVEQSIQVTGPRGVVPAQLTDIVYWPKGKWVKFARLAMLIDSLAPLTTDSYTVTYDTKSAPTPASDLQVAVGKETVEITTAALGLRLPLGKMRYATPLPLANVPGPLRALREGAGAWGGGSVFTGDALVTGWESRITDQGWAFERVETTYAFADGNLLTLAATVAAGDSAARWEMHVSEDRPAQGITFRLPSIPGVKKAILPKGYGQWARDRETAVTPGEKPVCYLSPNSSLVNIFAEDPPNIRLAGDGGAEWQLRSRDPSAWVDPVAPFTYGGYKSWNLEMIPKSWDNWMRKRMPVGYTADGTVTLSANLAKGGRKWSVSAGEPLVGEKLDAIKDMILDWPAAKDMQYPRLFLSKQEMDGKRDKAELVRTVVSLRDFLAKMGNYDVMRYGIATAGQYDALIDSGLLSAKDRALFRAQMAYLGYVMADPGCWSMERGYHSGNPNMSCSYTLTLGVIACLLSDHPKAKEWSDRATSWMNKWLADDVGPNGEWQPEASHYGYVSLAPLLSYAIAAQRAGYHDFLADPRLKKVILYFAKYQTPRDPQRGNVRVTPSFGRGTSGDKLGDFGVAARMYAGRDAEFSRNMQWLWTENGFPTEIGDTRLGGYEQYYVDKNLPASAPVWNSELFPVLGALLRAGFATPNESYVNLVSHVDSQRNLDIWTPGIGGIAQWYGRGKPLSTCFAFATGYNERHELLKDGVRLSHNWGAPEDSKGPFGYYTETKPGTFAALPQADYVRATFVNTKVDDRDWFPDKLPAFPRQAPAKDGTLTWTRQALFLKDADPAGPAYLVLRDTTSGGQPTAWQFWTLSEKIGTPAQAADAAFLTNKPGKAILPARELLLSDRYTAAGQQGVDVEYFIASPTGTPRHTLRYGGVWLGVPEYQDLLHLQQPGDGAYYVVLYPHPRTEAAPTFTALNGGIIRIAGAFGTDYAFLATEPSIAIAEGAGGVEFRGTSGAIQQRGNTRTLTLGASGLLQNDGITLSAPFAASLQVTPETLTVRLPADSPGGEVTIIANGNWALKDAPATVKLVSDNNKHVLTVPKGIISVILAKN